MYQRPKVERFGTFRDLTRVGFTGAADGMGELGVPGTGSNCRWDREPPPPARLICEWDIRYS